MKMSNFSQSALGVMSNFKNHSGKIAELAAERGTLYQGSGRLIFQSGGKNAEQNTRNCSFSPPLTSVVFFIIIIRAIMGAFFLLI